MITNILKTSQASRKCASVRGMCLKILINNNKLTISKKFYRCPRKGRSHVKVAGHSGQGQHPADVGGRVQLVAPEYAGVSNNAPRWARRGALLDTPAYSGATN